MSDPEEVEDLLQSIFVKVYEKHHTLKESGSAKAWLFQIASNAINDYYRKKNRSLDNDTVSWFSSESGDAINGLSDCIIPFIARLPEESAGLLMAVDIDGESQKHYASRVDVAYSTIKSRVQKARGQLKQLFLDCCQYSYDHRGRILDFEPDSKKCDNC